MLTEAEHCQSYMLILPQTDSCTSKSFFAFLKKQPTTRLTVHFNLETKKTVPQVPEGIIIIIIILKTDVKWWVRAHFLSISRFSNT